MIKTSISILDCDFNNLEYEINRVNNSNSDLIHIDIMDGKFVPNNTLEKFDMNKYMNYLTIVIEEIGIIFPNMIINNISFKDRKSNRLYYLLYYTFN